MKYLTPTFLFLLTTTSAQRPRNITICDYWTPVILGSKTASNQAILLTLLVNTFVLGNYTTPNIGLPVAGIASPAIYNGTQLTLINYFTGALNSTNEGGDHGTSRLFLDDGSAGALGLNMSSSGNIHSAQYNLLTHIYQYFGTLLGCSLQGGSEFPSYQGRTSMYEVHKYMNLDIYAMDFFIQQVVLSATSLGISSTDAGILGQMLDSLFNFRCLPPASIPDIPAKGAELQSVCLAENCPLGDESDCALYPDDGVALVPVNITAVEPGSGNSTAGNGTASTPGGPALTSGVMNSYYGHGLVLVVATVMALFWSV